MELTDEEKELFRMFDSDLEELPSYHIEPWLMQSYDVNDKNVQITFGYIKRILLEVAKKRGLTIHEDISYETDELLKNIVEVPKELTDFNPVLFKSADELNKYIQSKTKDMNLTERKEFFRLFDGYNGIGGIYYGFYKFIESFVYKILEKINELNYEAMTEITDLDENPEESNYFDEQMVTNQELEDLIKFLNVYPELMEYKTNARQMAQKLENSIEEKTLSQFYGDKEFYENLRKIMNHDNKKHKYYFHGTQSLEGAESILKEGLGMADISLESTAVAEMEIKEVLLYNRSFDKAIGRDAVVIIDIPIEDNGKRKNIVKPMPKGKKVHFTPSGTHGLNRKPEYIIDSKYIVGYIDKKNKKVIFNDKYISKPDNSRPANTGLSDRRMADGIKRFSPNIPEITEHKQSELGERN